MKLKMNDAPLPCVRRKIALGGALPAHAQTHHTQKRGVEVARTARKERVVLALGRAAIADRWRPTKARRRPVAGK